MSLGGFFISKRKPQRKYSIRDIYIIHDSGLCLVSSHLSKGDPRSEMISGFLIAIADFAQQILGESIQEVKLDQHLITYKKNGPLFIAIVSELKGITKKKMDNLVDRIISLFLEDYVVYLQEGIIEPRVFSGFKETLDEIRKAPFAISSR
jgi:hypothetical protein